MRVCDHAQGLELGTGAAFLGALGLWGAGVTLPVLEVTELYIFENAVSLIGVVSDLFEAGEWPVGLLVLLFTLILPPCKLLLGFYLWRARASVRGRTQKGIAFLDAIGKWAMLDVMILALVVVTLKSSWVAKVETAAGLYAFTGSVVLAVAAGIGLKRAALRAIA